MLNNINTNLPTQKEVKKLLEVIQSEESTYFEINRADNQLLKRRREIAAAYVELAERMDVAKVIITAMAHVGIDLGYGPFELDETHIQHARDWLDAAPKEEV